MSDLQITHAGTVQTFDKGRHGPWNPSGAPVSVAEIKQADGNTTVEFSQTTRAIMGMIIPALETTMTLNLAGGGTLILPTKAAIDAIFAPGGIVPFACDSFVFGNASETTLKVVGLF